jgi:hypothetical protein
VTTLLWLSEEILGALITMLPRFGVVIRTTRLRRGGFSDVVSSPAAFAMRPEVRCCRHGFVFGERSALHVCVQMALPINKLLKFNFLLIFEPIEGKHKYLLSAGNTCGRYLSVYLCDGRALVRRYLDCKEENNPHEEEDDHERKSRLS